MPTWFPLLAINQHLTFFRLLIHFVFLTYSPCLSILISEYPKRSKEVSPFLSPRCVIPCWELGLKETKLLLVHMHTPECLLHPCFWSCSALWLEYCRCINIHSSDKLSLLRHPLYQKIFPRPSSVNCFSPSFLSYHISIPETVLSYSSVPYSPLCICLFH